MKYPIALILNAFDTYFTAVIRQSVFESNSFPSLFVNQMPQPGGNIKLTLNRNMRKNKKNPHLRVNNAYFDQNLLVNVKAALKSVGKSVLKEHKRLDLPLVVWNHKKQKIEYIKPWIIKGDNENGNY